MALEATLKRATQHVLGRVGYRLTRTPVPSSDVFAIQGELVATATPVIFDVGAHVGSVARMYRQRWPRAVLHCFEPFPQSFATLASSLLGDALTSCHPLAVSDTTGSAVLNANRSAATNSLLPTDERGAAWWGDGLLETSAQVEVQTTTIDEFCIDKQIPHIDILKMDVQGAEYSVLTGAKRMLENQNISLIYTEMIMCPTYKGQRKLHEYLSFLDGFGFEVLDFFNPVKRGYQLMQADVVFLGAACRRQLRDRAVIP